MSYPRYFILSFLGICIGICIGLYINEHFLYKPTPIVSQSLNPEETRISCANSSNNSLAFNHDLSIKKSGLNKPSLATEVKRSASKTEDNSLLLHQAAIELNNISELDVAYTKQQEKLEAEKNRLIEQLIITAQTIELDDIEQLANVLALVSTVNDEHDIKIPEALINQSLESLSYRTDVSFEVRATLLSSFRHSITPEHYDTLIDTALNSSHENVIQETAIIADLILQSESDELSLRKQALESLLKSGNLADMVKNRISKELQ